MEKKLILKKILKYTVNCFVIFLLINIFWTRFFPKSYMKLINFVIGAQEPPAEDFRAAELDDGTVEIITYIVNMEIPKNVVVIPSEIDGKPVARIGFGAFSAHRQITEITIPDTVQRIENMAFYASALQNVHISANVTYIGSEAFRNNNLSAIVIPDNVREIGFGAFFGNNITRIEIPANVNLHDGQNPVFENGFADFYEEHGKKAGIYAYSEEDLCWFIIR